MTMSMAWAFKMLRTSSVNRDQHFKKKKKRDKARLNLPTEGFIKGSMMNDHFDDKKYQ